MAPGDIKQTATPDMVTDDVVRAAQTGDREAVTTLIRAIQPPVTRYCRSRLGNYADADDAAQATCIAVLKALPRYQFRGRPFGAFVYTVASNKCMDAHRAAARGPVLVADTALAERPDSRFEEPGAGLFAQADADEMHELLAQLTPHQRQVVALRITEPDLTAADIAKLLDPPSTPGAVRVAMHRAVKELRKIITREGAA